MEINLDKKALETLANIGFTRAELAEACNLTSGRIIYRVLNGTNTHTRVDAICLKKHLYELLRVRQQKAQVATVMLDRFFGGL